MPKEIDSGIILPTPMKGKTRRATVGMAALFAVKIADDYIGQCASGKSNDLVEYAAFSYNALHQKCKEVEAKSKDGNFDVVFGKDDVYNLSGDRAKVAKTEAQEKLRATARFIMSTVRIYMEKQKDEKLSGFLRWLPNYIKRI